MQAPISRARYVQENRKMRFKEASQGWSGERLTQAAAAMLLGWRKQIGNGGGFESETLALTDWNRWRSSSEDASSPGDAIQGPAGRIP